MEPFKGASRAFHGFNLVYVNGRIFVASGDSTRKSVSGKTEDVVEGAAITSAAGNGALMQVK